MHKYRPIKDAKTASFMGRFAFVPDLLCKTLLYFRFTIRPLSNAGHGTVASLL